MTEEDSPVERVPARAVCRSRTQSRLEAQARPASTGSGTTNAVIILNRVRAMSIQSVCDTVNVKVGHVLRGLKTASRNTVTNPVAKATNTFSGAAREWVNKIVAYSRRASEDSDGWAEVHLYSIAGIAAAAGIILGVFLALP